MDAYQYAISILKRYRVWDKITQSVRKYLLKADPRYDRIKPGELDGKPQYHFRVMGPEYMFDAAAKKAKDHDIPPHILVASLNDMEALDAAEVMAYLAQEIEFYGRRSRRLVFSSAVANSSLPSERQRELVVGTKNSRSLWLRFSRGVSTSLWRRLTQMGRMGRRMPREG